MIGYQNIPRKDEEMGEEFEVVKWILVHKPDIMVKFPKNSLEWLDLTIKHYEEHSANSFAYL
jgi:hypothetical protein